MRWSETRTCEGKRLCCELESQLINLGGQEEKTTIQFKTRPECYKHYNGFQNQSEASKLHYELI